MSEDRKMYPIICSGCGKDSEVPFSPKPDKPVYCKECLPKHRAGKNVTTPSSEDSQKPTNVDCSDMFKQFENWQKMTNVAGPDMLKQFENWQKTMSESYLQSMKAYSEMMNKFAESWKKTSQD